MMYEVPSDIESLIQAQIASGNYHSPDDVLRSALQNLAAQRNAAARQQGTGSALDALAKHGLVGSVKSGHKDLSSNPSHMKGFGRNGK